MLSLRLCMWFCMLLCVVRNSIGVVCVLCSCLSMF